MVSVRPFRESDRPYLRTICRATSGDFFQCRRNRLEAVSVLYNDYYTFEEPEHIFVAVDDEDIPVGYVLCSVDSERYKRQIAKKYLLLMVKKSPVMLFIFLLGNVYPLSKVPEVNRVHLHIDILEEYQHMHLGSMLLTQLRKHLHEQGYETLNVVGMDAKSDALNFYKHYGFRVFAKHPFQMCSLTIPTSE